MNGHIHEWLNAYHDGELRGRRLERVEAHLQDCPECREALAELEALSSLLRAEPLPPISTNPEQFAAQINLRLPRRSNSARQTSEGSGGWRMSVVPLGILAAAGFLRSVTWVTNLLTVVEGSGLKPGAVSWLLPASSTPPNTLQRFSLLAVDLGVPLNLDIFLSLLLPLMLAAGYLTWLALWWSAQDRTEIEQTA
jgi:anti-sigma factor RsiW